MNSRLCFTDDDLARHLKEAWLLEIGSALNSDLPENWIALATRLGLKNEEIDSLRHVPNPGYAVIRIWKTGPNATIRVLRNALVQMKRHDVIDLLQKAITGEWTSLGLNECNVLCIFFSLNKDLHRCARYEMNLWFCIPLHCIRILKLYRLDYLNKLILKSWAVEATRLLVLFVVL